MLRRTKVTFNTGEFIAAIVTILVGTVLLGLFSAWILMLLLGMFAGYLGTPGLALGFWASYGVYLMTRLIWFKASAETD